MDQRDDFPPKLLRKLYGEIEADGLRDHITAGWDAAVENSELLKEVEGYVPMSSTLEIIHKYHIISAQISAWEKPF